jgi:streptogramin lyase
VDKVMVPGYEFDWFYSALLEPRWSNSGPNGEVLIVGRDGKTAFTIYEIIEDFQLVEFVSFPGLTIMSFEYDQNGRLWFSTIDGKLYTVDSEGSPEVVVDSLYPNKSTSWATIKISNNGDIYAADQWHDNRIFRISPEGEKEVFTDDLIEIGKFFTMGPNDDILVHDRGAGQLVLFKPNGEKTILINGTPQYEEEFNGSFFLTDETLIIKQLRQGVFKYDLATREKEPAERFWNPLGSFVYAYLLDSKTVIAFDQYGVISMNMEAEETKTIFLPLGNTWAMAVGPDSKLYAAYGEPPGVENGKTFVYRVDPQDGMILLGSLPGNNSNGMDFDSDGIGYILTQSSNNTIWVHKFDPVNNSFTEYLQSPRDVDLGYSLAIDPISGTLWSGRTSGDGVPSLHYYESDETTGLIPLPEGTYTAHPVFSSEGILYIGVIFNEERGKPTVRKVYHLGDDKSWNEIADLTIHSPDFELDTFAIAGGGNYVAVCPNGEIFVFGHISAHLVDPEYLAGTGPAYSIVNITNGDFIPIAQRISTDGLKVDCDPLTGDLYFTSSDGIHRLIKKSE